MARKKLPADAFSYYVVLGTDRTYDAVAEKFGVNSKTVARRASKEGWQEKLKEIAKEVLEETVSESASVLKEERRQDIERVAQLQKAMRNVATPKRMEAVLATLFKAAIKHENLTAARILMDRVYGKSRNELLPATAMPIVEGLETAAEVRRSANAVLQAVSEGLISPDEAQKAVSVIEAARKSVETEELELRIAQLEEQAKRGGGR